MNIYALKFNTVSNNKKNNLSNTSFQKNRELPPLDKITRNADLKVFHHHIYEFKKGIRNLILTTENDKYREEISQKLERENIDYVIHTLDNGNINVYFGEKACVDVVKTFNPRLNKLTAEQDFMLGIMLGYDRVKQCVRYLKLKDTIFANNKN